MLRSNSLLALLTLPLTIVLVAPNAHAQQGWDFFDKPPPLPRWTETSAAPEPRPPEAAAPRFGAKGEFVVTGASNISISSEQYSASPASDFSATFSPGLDYFVVSNLSIGITADIAYTDDKGYDASGNLFATKTTTFIAGPRVGFNIPFGDYLSWYPRIAFGLVTERTNEQLVTATTNPNGAPFATSSGSATGAWADVFAPILVHPSRHFFFGAGPNFSHDFTHLEGTSTISGQVTGVSGQFVIGGWWGGTPEADRLDAPSTRGPARRFGEAGEWVFTGESSFSISSTRYSVQGSSSSVMVAPGFDYFLVDDVSIGANVYVGSDKSTGTDDTGTPYTNSSTTYGLAGHLAVNIPLGPSFSLYPRGYFGFGGGSYNDTAGSDSNQASQSGAWVSLYLPLLVHPAPHFFAGFGPSVNHQLSSDYTFAGGQQLSNPGTVLSADLIVGGWL
jgi:hypothetical protein